MKGSSISVRIADFLKEYPPFQFLEVERLRELASKSKVKFQEEGEIVFSQGQPRDQWIYVLQQGRVRIVEESEHKETLIDLRGAGDILGLQGIRTEDPYIHTCKTESEVILYGLPREEFVAIAESSTEARRYLAAYFSLNPTYHWNDYAFEDDLAVGDPGPITLRRGGLREIDPVQAAARTNLVVVMGDTSVRDAALKLQSKMIDCITVIDEAGLPIGKLTDTDLRDRLLEGSVQPSAAVRDLMYTDLVAAGPQDNTGDLLLKLAQHGKKFLVITEDGTLKSRAIGLISERMLFLQYGRFPTVVGEAIECAPDIDTLRSLRDRLEALILEFLENRSALIWLMDIIGIMNRKFSMRIVELMADEMESDGLGRPPKEFSWLMMGSGGRNELLIRSAVYHALVYDDPNESEKRTVEKYFQELALRSANAIRLCGFLESPQGVLAHHAGWCLPISRMKERFTNFIKNPVASHVYSARDAFDFQPLRTAGCRLADELSLHIEQALAENQAFKRHMASDSMMNQPPRTLFQGYVVDQEGTRRADLAIKFHALLPLVDVARVFTLEIGSHRPTGTYQRLKIAASRFGEDTELGQLLKEAAEAFLVAQYARISQGLRTGTDGAVIHPGDLDPETRTLLVTSFRTILDVLEATARRYDLTLRG